MSLIKPPHAVTSAARAALKEGPKSTTLARIADGRILDVSNLDPTGIDVIDTWVGSQDNSAATGLMAFVEFSKLAVTLLGQLQLLKNPSTPATFSSKENWRVGKVSIIQKQIKLTADQRKKIEDLVTKTSKLTASNVEEKLDLKSFSELFKDKAIAAFTDSFIPFTGLSPKLIKVFSKRNANPRTIKAAANKILVSYKAILKENQKYNRKAAKAAGSTTPGSANSKAGGVTPARLLQTLNKIKLDDAFAAIKSLDTKFQDLGQDLHAVKLNVEDSGVDPKELKVLKKAINSDVSAIRKAANTLIKKAEALENFGQSL